MPLSIVGIAVSVTNHCRDCRAVCAHTRYTIVLSTVYRVHALLVARHTAATLFNTIVHKCYIARALHTTQTEEPLREAIQVPTG